ncbi:MAG: ABC transporter ATP-binding protein [Breznakibacter sp.]
MITVDRISKHFGRVKAVDQASMAVAEGELLGLIGPDGAGKTTLLRMINSLMVPTSGRIDLWGLDPVADYKKVRLMIGYMPGKFSLYTDLTVEENLRFFATVFGASVEENYHLIADIYSQIEPFRKRKAGQLSGGMKQKLALSCALVHKPKLLVLDEPTTGVDAVSRTEFWEMLQKLKHAGITIIVSTPYMDEAALCDRVALMQNGHIMQIDTPAAITKGFGSTLFAVRTDHKYAALNALRQSPHARSVYPYGETLHYTDRRPDAQAGDIIRWLQTQDVPVDQVEVVKPGIEDLFMELMG